LADNSHPQFTSVDKKYLSLTGDESYMNKDIQKIFSDLTKAEYKQKVEPSLLLPRKLGNSYTASLYMGLLSLISNKQNDLVRLYTIQFRINIVKLNKRLLMFSYGSGLAATMWSFNVNAPVADIAKKANIAQRLEQRTAVTPEEYTRVSYLICYSNRMT
jgi:hydroxymethylglutaryl-CoA synthase